MKIEPFEISDCALAAIATGKSAQNLREMRDHLSVIHPGSIDYHFWGRFLRPSFDEPEYSNDFASWAYYGLNDLKMAERLSVIDPARHSDIDSLRRELIEVIEVRLDESEHVPWCEQSRRFHFVRSQLVRVQTSRRFGTPEELAVAVPGISLGSIYYHFIDSRRRNPARTDDFRAWLAQFGAAYEPLCSRLGSIELHFTTLTGIRYSVINAFSEHFGKE